MFRDKFKDKCIVLVFALTASLPLMVSYNIVGEELLWYLVAAENVLGFSVDGIYRLFVAGVNLVTVFVAYASFGKCFQSSIIGVLASGLYLLCPYRIYLLYIRSAVGEYLAMMFLPLLVWGIGDICRKNREKKGYLWNGIIAIIGFGGTVGTYILERKAREMSGAFGTEVLSGGIDSALLLCVLLWIGLQLGDGSGLLLKERKRERFVANVMLVVGIVLLLVVPTLTVVATLCMLITVGSMGKGLISEEQGILPGQMVLYALIIMTLIFGTYRVNEVLMNSANIMFL